MLELIEERINPYLEELSLELVDLEYVKEGGYNYLRVYIEKKSGETSIEDCVELSTLIDNVTDDLIEEKFYLEVSTPGLERKLKKEKDFLKFIGKEVKIKTISNIENKKKFLGKLQDFKNDTVYIVEKSSEILIEIPLIKIKEARLVYNLSENIFKEVNNNEI